MYVKSVSLKDLPIDTTLISDPAKYPSQPVTQKFPVQTKFVNLDIVSHGLVQLMLKRGDQLPNLWKENRQIQGLARHTPSYTQIQSI